MESAIYEGTVRHRRHAPIEHEFTYRMFQCWIDLDELPTLFDDRWFWSARGPSLSWFRRADFLGDESVPLKTAVLDRAEEELGRRPTGPVRMLAHLRTFGVAMNPVVFYYCYDASGSHVEAVVAEITNTPWNERFSYVLGGADAPCGTTHRFAKRFHISPFIDMDCEYEWNLGAPGDGLRAHMRNLRGGEPLFDATLDLKRRAMTGRALASALTRHPLLTTRVIAAIYWQALRLRLKGAPFFAHPDKRDLALDQTR